MRAALVVEPGQLDIGYVADPVPLDHQAVVAVDTCGICGTDVHVLDGDYGVVRYPVIPGHEFAGTVVEVGSAVRTVRPGQRVAVDPMDYCDACELCRSGWTNMCLNGGGLGTTAPGALAEYVAVNAARCEPIPDEMSFDRASLIEPLACVLHGVDRLGSVLGRSALVFGAGPIGLLMCRLLAIGGASVDAVDRAPVRLAAAATFGAIRTAGTVAELDQPNWEVVVDATGNPEAVRDALRVTARAGRLGLLGVSGPRRSFDFEPFDVVARELTIVGINSVRHTFGRARQLLASDALPVQRLHGEPFALAEAATALAHTREARGFKTRVRITEDRG